MLMCENYTSHQEVNAKRWIMMKNIFLGCNDYISLHWEEIHFCYVKPNFNVSFYVSLNNSIYFYLWCTLILMYLLSRNICHYFSFRCKSRDTGQMAWQWRWKKRFCISLNPHIKTATKLQTPKSMYIYNKTRWQGFPTNSETLTYKQVGITHPKPQDLNDTSICTGGSRKKKQGMQ